MDQSTLISVSLAVYVTASVYVAAVRWGHRCAPYAKHMDYYYPALSGLPLRTFSSAGRRPLSARPMPCLMALLPCLS